MKNTKINIRFVAAALLGLSATVFLPIAARADRDRSAVYTETNNPASNAIAVFDKAPSGALTLTGFVPTGGTGTGANLGNQGAVVLSEDGSWMFAVNAGSNDISVFWAGTGGPTLVGRYPSGGMQPISLTIHGSLLYALNAGGVSNITGFWVGSNGALTQIPASGRPLSGNSVGAAEVQFSRDGKVLLVSEKATSLIDSYTVDMNGFATGPSLHASSGATPFGFAFGNDGIAVFSEASGSVTSYLADWGGGLTVATGSLPTNQAAPCWIAVSGNGKYAYTTNAGSGSISGYRIAANGTLSPISGNGIVGITGPGTTPIDMAVSRNDKFLYALLRGTGSVAAFRIIAGTDGGGLIPIGTVSGLPSTVSGLAAR